MNNILLSTICAMCYQENLFSISLLISLGISIAIITRLANICKNNFSFLLINFTITFLANFVKSYSCNIPSTAQYCIFVLDWRSQWGQCS